MLNLGGPLDPLPQKRNNYKEGSLSNQSLCNPSLHPHQRIMASLRYTLALFVTVGLGATTQERGDDLRSCLTEALHGAEARAHLPADSEYATSLNPFNLNLRYNASAVVYPNSTEEVVNVISCAGKYGRKVQARGGGRDFINRCK